MAADLLDRSGERVPLNVQQDGYDLADRGDVELFHSPDTGGRFLALVFAQKLREPRVVRISWSKNDRDTLMASCSCEDVKAWQGCRHIWGTLEAMNREGYGGEIPGTDPLVLGCSRLGRLEKSDLLRKLLVLSKDTRAPKVPVSPPPRIHSHQSVSRATGSRAPREPQEKRSGNPQQGNRTTVNPPIGGRQRNPPGGNKAAGHQPGGPQPGGNPPGGNPPGRGKEPGGNRNQPGGKGKEPSHRHQPAGQRAADPRAADPRAAEPRENRDGQSAARGGAQSGVAPSRVAAQGKAVAGQQAGKKPPLATATAAAGRQVASQPARKFIKPTAPKQAAPQPPDWRRQLNTLIPKLPLVEPRLPRRLFYVLGAYNTHQKTWALEFWQQEMQANGQWSVLKVAPLVATEVGDLEPIEQQLLRRLFEAYREGRSDRTRGQQIFRGRMVSVPSAVLPLLLPTLIATGRFGKIADPNHHKRFEPYEWDSAGPWWLVIEGCEALPGHLTLRGRLRRGSEDLPITRFLEILPGGLFLRGNRLAEIEAAASEEWLKSLQQAPEIVVPEREVAEALTLLAKAPGSPALELDKKWQQRIGEAPPIPSLRVTLRTGDFDLPAQLLFGYGSLDISPDDPHELLFDTPNGKIFRRARAAERDFTSRLPGEFDTRGYGILPAEGSAHLLESLAADGWRISTTDRRIHSGGRFTAKIESGIDWFDLSGGLQIQGQEIPLPSLLQAAREGRGWVNLADGSIGLMPAGWADRWASLIELSRTKKNLRFDHSQALVLDNLLRHETGVETDALFGRIRDKLRSFDHLEPTQEPPGFLGELRPYQRLGLAWLELLAELKLGGCLADDMGLGKTIQVLAWMLRRKQAGANKGKPSLLVVPRSLVFNWVAELKRFTPDITYVVSHGVGRENALEQVNDVDLFITTYGTLVRDIDKLKKLSFDVMVVDEAQAIKNRTTLAAEACSAVPALHRLALTGTPVENHLGELWSIFDFLNPGLLGSLPKTSQYAGRLKLPEAALAEVASALRPLILRRKKSEVLKDLPAKTEQTIVCELGPKERQRYDELRLFYQASLEKQIEEVGLDRSKILVLEALLRLRQAACHPGLIDKNAQDQSSAKLEALLETLEQVLEEGHKAIVFSQFTSLLSILKLQLDQRGLEYEYLDGKTRDREARVNRFQNNAEPKLFLISLKAGGVGLNLTAASYVFLLDPWWNPAVEAQAIDRAHRIGQDQPVFAYRIIAADTVEEKILKLQEEKRNLADAIIAEDQRVLKQLTAADLQQLLS